MDKEYSLFPEGVSRGSGSEVVEEGDVESVYDRRYGGCLWNPRGVAQQAAALCWGTPLSFLPPQ